MNEFVQGGHANFDYDEHTGLFYLIHLSSKMAEITLQPGNPDKITVYGDFYEDGLGMPEDLDFTLVRSAP